MLSPCEKNMVSEWWGGQRICYGRWRGLTQNNYLLLPFSVLKASIIVQTNLAGLSRVSKNISRLENIPFQVIVTVTQALNSGK